MALDNAAIDALAEQLREAARRQRSKVRPDIVASYKQLVALPPEERAAERQRRVADLTAHIHQNVPAKDPENAAVTMGMLRQGMGQLLGDKVAVGEITDDQLTRLVAKWRQGVEQDSQAEAREIMQEAGAAPPVTPKHTRRPHINI
mgnify:FL=1